MREVLYSVAMSLDGYIAGPGGEFDWIPEEPAIDWGAFTGRFDTVVMGRKTYEVVAGEGSEGGLPEMETIVFSRTLSSSGRPDVTVTGEEPGPVVEELRKRTGRGIWLMGGGMLFRTLLEAGAVDGVEVAVVPVLLGDGIRMLPPWKGRAELTLTETKTYPSGIVLLRYDVRSSTA